MLKPLPIFLVSGHLGPSYSVNRLWEELFEGRVIQSVMMVCFRLNTLKFMEFPFLLFPAVEAPRHHEPPPRQPVSVLLKRG